VIGIVQMGMEFGLLATTASGNYVRVNGSQIEALNNEAVEPAIAFARTIGRGESYATSRSSAPDNASAAIAPTVIFRKRRRAVMEFQNGVVPKPMRLDSMPLAA
jgi:hypothetical protein